MFQILSKDINQEMKKLIREKNALNSLEKFFLGLLKLTMERLF